MVIAKAKEEFKYAVSSASASKKTRIGVKQGLFQVVSTHAVKIGGSTQTLIKMQSYSTNFQWRGT